MKKIFKFIILLVICFMPVIGKAKANFEYDNVYFNILFSGSKDGLDYFYNKSANLYDDGFILIYDKEGELIKEDKLVENSDYTYSDIGDSKYYKMFPKIYLDDNSIIDDGSYYYVNYIDEKFYYYESSSWKESSISFEDDENLTRKLIGNKYDIYLKYKEEIINIRDIYEYNGIYIIASSEVVYGDYTYTIIDEKYNILFDFIAENYYPIFYTFDNLIYVFGDSSEFFHIDVYNKKGIKVDTLLIGDELLKYDKHYCRYFRPKTIYVYDDYLYISFDYTSGCPARVEMNDVSEIVTVTDDISNLTLRYKLNYEIEAVESTDGDFEYDEKIDEDGKNYVELKVTPKKKLYS